jgi:hypothetical protein
VVTRVGSIADETSLLRSFEIGSGRQLTETELDGGPFGFETTNRWVWVRTTRYSGEAIDGAGRPAMNTLLRIDPASGAVTLTAPYFDDGPIAASGSRLAASDDRHLEIYDDERALVSATTIADAIGKDNWVVRDDDRPPADLGFSDLAFGPAGLVGRYRGGAELVAIDPDTGLHLTTRTFPQPPDLPIGPSITMAGDVLWSEADAGLVRIDLPLDQASAASDLSVPAPDIRAIEQVAGSTVVVLTPSTAAVLDGADVGPISTHLDPEAANALVHWDGRPWVAQWSNTDADRPTTITFVPVRTDDSAEPGSGTIPADPPPSTMLGNGTSTLRVPPTDP